MRPDPAIAAPAVPAPKAKRMPRAQREQLMLDAAVSVFSRSGYHSASMDEIAEAGGVSKPMLYLYLGSKEQLFAACLRREASRLVDAFRDAAASELPPGEQLFGGLVAFFRFVAERRESWTLLNQHSRSSGGEPVVAEVGQVRRLVVSAVTALVRRAVGSGAPETAAGRDRGEAAAIAEAIVGAADAVANWVAETGPEPPEETARRLMSVLWIGLEPRMRGARYAG